MIRQKPGVVVCLTVILISGVISGNASAGAPVTSLAFSPDGNAVLAASQAGVAIYDWPSQTRRNSIPVEMANVQAIQFSPDRTQLAVAGGNPGETGVVQLLSWPDLKSVHVIHAHDDSIFSIQWTANSKELLTSSLDTQILRLNPQAQNPVVQQYSEHSKGVTCVTLLSDRKAFVSAGIDQSLRVWDIGNAKSVRSFNNHTAPVNVVVGRPTVEGLPMVASCAEDQTIRFWQPTIGRMVRFAKLDAAPLNLVWHPELPIVAVSTATGAIVFVDMETAEVLQRIKTDTHWLYAIAVSPDAKWVVTADASGLRRTGFVIGKKSIVPQGAAPN